LRHSGRNLKLPKLRHKYSTLENYEKSVGRHSSESLIFRSIRLPAFDNIVELDFGIDNLLILLI
jgi:hypothetical protein